jgi:hypothetical protein
MDSTLPYPGSTGMDAIPHGFWYRVVGVSGPTTVNSQQVMTLELQDLPKMDATNGRLTLFEQVVEVFDKGLGWLAE